LRNDLVEAASRSGLFVAWYVLADTVGVVDREFVLGSGGDERVVVGRAARSAGLFVGVDVFVLLVFVSIVTAGVAGDWRAFAVVVAMSGLRDGKIEAGEADEF